MTKQELKRVMRAEGRRISDYTYAQVIHAKRCWYCGEKFKHPWEKVLHHEIPVCLGGKNTIENLRCVHESCHPEADKKSFEKYGGNKG